VDTRELLRRVVHEITQTLDYPDQRIRIDVDGDVLRLPSQSATALALTINELIQNAVEHTFSGRLEGHIHIRLLTRKGGDEPEKTSNALQTQ
jgi:two-component sensor histidine kinase